MVSEKMLLLEQFRLDMVMSGFWLWFVQKSLTLVFQRRDCVIMIHKAQPSTMECISAAQKSVLAHVGGPFGNTWPASVHTPKSVEEWIGKSVRSCKKGQFRADFRPPFPSAPFLLPCPLGCS